MKQQIVFEDAKLFGVKDLGNGCRFGIRFNSKQSDGTYTKGTFLNCRHKEKLSDSQLYTLTGFISTNVYKDNETLEFIAMTATPQGKAPAKTNTTETQEDIPF